MISFDKEVLRIDMEQVELLAGGVLGAAANFGAAFVVECSEQMGVSVACGG